MSSEFSETRLKVLRALLDQWWDVVAHMHDDSPPEAWKRMVSYLSPDCVIHGTSKPFYGHDGALEWMKQLLSFWRIEARTISIQGLDLGGMVLTTALEVSLVILGENIDFSEVVVVTFDKNDLIKDYKPYCDPAPILAIMERRKGNQADSSKRSSMEKHVLDRA
ncbi:hypothetical protein MRS44_017021 [Fusarium solani]|uniref:SnoaL-like domain-containing protein n=1 Tax=Fusarium solani TaxID=169388 RepID=A0A9P9GR17_FUSSL|nr:uncharacterized protein B0J15DRAFT_552782 [Fusarium solani]KAH7243925.1 hypothetical protein B0J15DRAFT_552782 [Fusarium solani]KAJ3455539.1 hypothetical protein MRS44_017021 [Fusarium solani]KAJ4191809.1 hypothetical protein NW759_016666 [Fusarium solani]